MHAIEREVRDKDGLDRRNPERGRNRFAHIAAKVSDDLQAMAVYRERRRGQQLRYWQRLRRVGIGTLALTIRVLLTEAQHY